MGGYALTGSLGREPLSDGDSTVPVLQTCASYPNDRPTVQLLRPWSSSRDPCICHGINPERSRPDLGTKAAMKARNTPAASLLRHLQRETVRLTALPCPAGVAQQEDYSLQYSCRPASSCS